MCKVWQLKGVLTCGSGPFSVIHLKSEFILNEKTETVCNIMTALETLETNPSPLCSLYEEKQHQIDYDY